MACVLLALGLGACAPLTTLPDPPASGGGAREFPGPFDGYDSARPPAYKAPPTPSPSPSSRGGGEEDESDFGGILRPGLPWPPWGREWSGRD